MAVLWPFDAQAGGAPPPATCAVARFDGVRTVVSRASRAADEARAATEDVDRQWHAAVRAIGAILGDEPSSDSEEHLREQLRAILADPSAALPCDAGAPARDRLAYRLSLLGYSLDDIARVTAGGATKAALDRDAQRRSMGLPPAPLTSRASASVAAPVPIPDDGLNVAALRPTWNRNAAPAAIDVVAAGPIAVPADRLGTAARPSAPVVQQVALRLPPPAPSPAPVPAPVSPSVIDWWARYYALSYGVDYRLVAAVIRQESNGQVNSVSQRGAVGLMQLMPATAAMLRVNPRDPIDNLRGGIAYLAGLLSSYRNVRTALIAYNAGPAHADSVVRGERQPYPETQRYLQAVDAIYPIDQRR